MKEKIRKVLEKMGLTALPRPIFYQAPIAMRFEIGNPEEEIYDSKGRAREAYVNHGLERVMTIYEKLNSSFDVLLISVFCENAAEGIKDLEECKRKINLPRQSGELSYLFPLREDSQFLFFWDIKKEHLNLEGLFRESIRGDLGGNEEFVDSVFLLDTTNEVLFHLYDDRGLDVVASKKERLVGIFLQCNNWILPYDKEAIEEKFQPRPKNELQNEQI